MRQAEMTSADLHDSQRAEAMIRATRGPTTPTRPKTASQSDPAFLERRRLHRRRDDRGVNQCAAFDDPASRVELTVDLGQKLLRQAEFLDALAEASPDRAECAEAPKRQPIAQGFLRAGVGEPTPLLEKQQTGLSCANVLWRRRIYKEENRLVKWWRFWFIFEAIGRRRFKGLARPANNYAMNHV